MKITYQEQLKTKSGSLSEFIYVAVALKCHLRQPCHLYFILIWRVVWLFKVAF